MAETVRLSRELYSPAAVDAAVRAYAALATFTVQVGEEHIEIGIADANPDVAPVLADELCNHILHETVVRRRGATP